MTIDASRIRSAREAKDWSQDDLAAHAKVSQQTIGKLETGAARSSKFIARIAAALDVQVGELDPDFAMVARIDARGNFRPPPDFFGDRDLPVYSAAEGGPGEMVVSTEAIEWVPRPWFMKEVKEGFAILIVGESMEPAYEPGDMAIVNPRLTPLRNKDAIFTTGEHGGVAGGEFKATIKRLVRSDAKSWHVRQFNEPREFALERKDWPKALRVVGKLSGG